MKYLISLCCAIFLFIAWTSQAGAHGGEGMGGMDKMDACVQKKGHYTVHFSAYQQQYGESAIGMLQEVGSEKLKREFQSYCEGLPKTGKMAITFDLLNEEMRDLPISVQIVSADEDRSKGHEDGDSAHSHAIVSLPPTVYRDGSIRLTADIPTAGHYKAIMKLEEVGPGIAHKPHTAADPGELDLVRHSHGGGSDPTDVEMHAVDPTFTMPFTVGLTQAAGSSFVSTVGLQVIGIVFGLSVLVGGLIFFRNGKQKKEA
ncbi:MAG: hypothetical protein F9K13_11495 [Candidatus Methylomirabilis oxygeniifera]|uniref:Uncharacterized protein n=1 Tax=Methylomirabilis oxygeniifera TaxID=671143 RepID=D5MK86_METO1|nr:MAG: hypothetical protein F9K13_11495 [Candidatus Methylomirabilis oxyfera]CBE69708.1 Conserved protein of unknown function; pmoD (singleton) [Candidatus Methylomirabilis oxyfera]